jgi:bifunctional ADP-heptose synthase (sugar kinase/adenylyltransferase)
LSRLDLKDWTPTPPELEARLIASLEQLAPRLDVLIVMDQAGVAGMGAITGGVLAVIAGLQRSRPDLIIMADSRHGLGRFPSLIYKMNAAEFAQLTRTKCHLLDATLAGAGELAGRNQRAVFVTLAEQGIVGASPDTPACRVPALPLRGPIDIVGAGDTVTAALALALAAGATLVEAMELAQAAASLVVHQLGTTGVANPAEMRTLLCP